MESEEQKRATKRRQHKLRFAVFGILLLVIAALVAVQLSNKKQKLVCNSDKGGFTIVYDKSTITDYSVDNMEYNFGEQESLIENMGIDAYIKRLSDWYHETTGVSCSNA